MKERFEAGDVVPRWVLIASPSTEVSMTFARTVEVTASEVGSTYIDPIGESAEPVIEIKRLDPESEVPVSISTPNGGALVIRMGPPENMEGGGSLRLHGEPS